MLWRLGDELRADKQNNNQIHKFKLPIYSIKRKNGYFYLDLENANTVSSCGENVRSILAQVDSMKLEDGEVSSEVCWKLRCESHNFVMKDHRVVD